jgi:hypothetical protein
MIITLLHLLSTLKRLLCDGNVSRSRSEDRRVANPVRHGQVPGRRTSRRAGYLRAVRSDAGMSTAEYAVGTVAAVAFAVVLFKVVQSPAVHQALSGIVTGALNVHL